MNKRRGGRGSKYQDEFKRRLVAESHGDGVSVPMVSLCHGVPTNRMYAWRGDALFQPAASHEFHAAAQQWCCEDRVKCEMVGCMTDNNHPSAGALDAERRQSLRLHRRSEPWNWVALHPFCDLQPLRAYAILQAL